jgi:hypothetical protein
MLKEIFGDSKIGLKWILKRSWELYRKLKITMQEAFRRSWGEVRTMFNNKLYISLKLFVRGKYINITTTLQDCLSDSLEYIGEMIDKKIFYNISKRIYENYEELTQIFFNSSYFKFGEGIFIKEI